MSDREELAARLTGLWGEPVTVTEPAPLAGGASRETLRFTATGGGRVRDLVLRRDPAGEAGAAEMAGEAVAMRAAAAAGVPVPEVVDSGPSLGGRPYIVMGHVEGETIPRRILRDDRFAAVRPRLAGEFGEIAARVHTMRGDGLEALPDPDPLEALRELSDRYDTPRPAVELGMRWLADHPVSRTPSTVVHGDLRNGNAIVGPDGVRALLDWELVHRGDPVEDLGWLCVKAWRFGAAPPVGGLGSRAALLDGYERVAGWRPGDEQLAWWEVYGSLRWVLVCRRQAAVFLDGGRDSLEHAVIGRRVCEAEFDLLLALGHARTAVLPDPLEENTVPPAAAPHDEPGADRLLAAVAGALAGGELGEALPAGAPRFLGRVAANAIRIARRERLLGAALAERHRERLAALGVADDAALAAALRNGAADPAVAGPAVAGAVLDKLLVANPGYPGQPHAP